MKTSNSRYIISLLLCSVMLSSISCSNEHNENQTSTDTTAPLETTQVASKMPTVSTEMLAHGEEEHKNHCYKCHTDAVYTRDNRFVKSIDALSKQVVRCKDNTGVAWFDEDSEAVVQFLNQKYYKF